MNTAIIPFHFEVYTVRTQMIEGEPWFVLADVCKVLELSTPHKAAQRLDEDDRNKTPIMDSMGRTQETEIINESGLYTLILRSNKPQAKKFKRWVTAEVLPTIRKTGSYGTPQLPTDPMQLLELSFSAMKQQGQRIQVLEEDQHQTTEKLATIDQRFESLPITGAQTGPIKKAVRDLAQKMGGKPHHFRQAWRTLYDRYGIAAYRDLPRNKYDEALEFVAKVAEAYEGREIS